MPFNNNYGGYLQAYAIITVVKSMGHDVCLINRRYNKRPWGWILKKTIRNLLDFFCGKHPLLIIPNQEKEYYWRGKNMLKFVNNHIKPCSPPLYCSKKLRAFCENRFDYIIVGSDQVWRPDYAPNIEDFFLCFLNDQTKKIAYAASFGLTDPVFPLAKLGEYSTVLSDFKTILLREKSGLDFIHKYKWIVKKEPKVVLDPTMLLTQEQYKSLFSTQNTYHCSLFCYILDESCFSNSVINKVSSLFCLKPYYIIDSKKWKEDKCIMPSIEEWLCGISSANYVITDSFHGTVFSILFNKPFVVCPNSIRGNDRFETLLSHFNLTDRLVNSMDQLERVLNKRIDWDNVNLRIEVLRKESYNLLEAALEE